ncbi:2',5'-phosphodiesterase 12 [Trichonephila inaurata madagascariensis]|uniref:2',5'-phosphodiesterase 12 n=1 Tax=Trichonephila inaurata madagascariensis TaxID=2747483 RepID=A0A8X6XB00_9ARAC|nr:2',5'-phosphodiesterase 12 [Trichonephila inaurata madagascariensis]
MLISRTLVLNRIVKFLCRHAGGISENAQTVKVLNIKDKINIYFRYNDFPFKLERPITESVNITLSHIKRRAELHHKKELIKQYYFADGESEVKNSDKEIDVYLKQNDSILNANIPNCEAWAQSSKLVIGDIVYEVNYNPPTVKSLNLPDFMICGCPIRPHFIFECASMTDSVFKWYRSVSEEIGKKLLNENSTEIVIENERYWEKIHEGYMYIICTSDIGCFLKVVCSPKLNGRSGPDCSVESKTVVEVVPNKFPFEERQEYTRTFCDNLSMRCLSYNVLAKMYVEQQKYPYASEKARNTYYRKQLLLKELLGYKSDIICLQEVEDRVFERDLEPILNSNGYIGFYTKKGGHRYEGVATFFRSSKFKCKRKYDVLLNRIIKEKHIYEDLYAKIAGNCKDLNKLLSQHTVLQLVSLEPVDQSGSEVLVANTHLYSNKDSPEVRLLQTAICTYFIEHVVKIKNIQGAGVIFCGDFNSLPDSPTYNFLMSSKQECNINGNSVGNVGSSLKHNLCLDSACGVPEYTNYTGDFIGCLDYIFYSSDILKVTDVVPMPKHEHVIAQVGLPSEYFPSDHIALICTLQWKK